VTKNMELRLHLGLPKTATTTLQRFFSENVAGYLGPESSQIPQGFFGPYRAAFARQSPDWWQTKDSFRLRRRLSVAARRVSATSREKKVTFSWEGAIAGDLFVADDIGNPEGSDLRSPQVSHLAALLGSVFPKMSRARILLTVRRQPEWLASLYAQRSRRIQGASQADFEDQVRKLLHLSRLPVPIDYERTITELEEVFPNCSITVLPLELIGTQDYRDALACWLEADPPPPEVFGAKLNQRSWQDQTWNLRESDSRLRKSHAFRVAGNESEMSSCQSIVLSESVIREVIEAVSGSNRDLQIRCALPLPHYF
jgi:hypothetical protein